MTFDASAKVGPVLPELSVTEFEAKVTWVEPTPQPDKLICQPRFSRSTA